MYATSNVLRVATRFVCVLFSPTVYMLCWRRSTRTGHDGGFSPRFASSRRQSCKITHAPLRARIGPMSALAALSPGSTLPTPAPAPGTCKSANRAHHFPSGSKTQIWRQVPQAAARALPRAVAATGLGPGTLQTIESQVHFRERRLVPVSLNRQHETPTAEHLGFCFSQGPPCLGLLSLMELRFFGKAMVRIEGQNGRRLPEDPVQATASLSSALASSL